MHGYVWGLIFYAGHLFWFGYIIQSRGQGDARMIIYVITVCYFALFSGFWFWFKNQLDYRLVSRFKDPKGKCWALGCTWVISTVTFMYLTCYCSLAILDCFEGYPFINPLLPLVSWEWYVAPICYFGAVNCWIIIVLVNLTIARLLKKVDAKSLIFIVVLFCIPALFQPPLKKNIINKNEIAYLKPSWNDMNLTTSQKFYQISRQLDYVVLDNPKIKFIVIPESGFPHNLLDWESRLHAWTSLCGDDVSIFIGSHRYDGNKKYNCLYQIQNGKIINWYDKQHLVPFVERIPWLISKISLFEGLFTDHQNVFSYPTIHQSSVMAGFQPCICSELFFENKKAAQGSPVLFICNDAWLGLSYAQELAKRSAKLYSLRYQVTVLYVGSQEIEVMQP